MFNLIDFIKITKLFKVKKYQCMILIFFEI